MNANEKEKVILSCTFEKLFFKFIHDFISLLFLKDNNITIYKAFKEAKANFNGSLGSVLQNYKVNLKKNPEIEIKMENEDDTFDKENIEEENMEENKKEKINYFEDEINYEDEKSKAQNVYYLENPFAKNEEKKVRKIKGNTNFIKLPGIETMNEDNINRFINGGIYEKNQFKHLITFIENKRNTNVLSISISSKTVDGNFNIKLGEDICKYFYMEKKYTDGIYLVKSIFDKDDLEKFIKSKSTNNKNNINKLILFDNINDIFDNEIINTMYKINNILFIICLHNQEKNNNIKDTYQFTCNNNFIRDNEEYNLIQLII